MNVFEAVRDSVTARQAAESYGIKVSRNGMAVCPFHNDKNPSMKLDMRFHCFGCQADGDAIDFAANYFGLSKIDAAEKLAHDFGIPFDDKKRHSYDSNRAKGSRYDKRRQRNDGGRQKTTQPVRRKTREQLFEQTERRFFRIVADYNHLLKKWKVEYTPHPEDEEWHPLFVEALENMTFTEYLMDALLSADTEEKIDLMNTYRERVMKYEQRIREVAATEKGRTGSDNRNAQSR